MNVKKTISVLMMICLVLILNGDIRAQQKAAGQSSLVNMNTAGVTEMVKLPGVGEKIAQRIIDFRKKNGKFKRLEDIMKVKGIGEKTFARLRKMMTI